MCKYVNGNMCGVTDDVCPFSYWCSKIDNWKQNDDSKCMIAKNVTSPKGYYLVEMERKGWLYIRLGAQAIRIRNPYDYTPNFVKLRKMKDGDYKVTEGKK